MYFQRNTRAKFRLAATETDPTRIREFYDKMTNELGVLRRSAVLNKLYEGPKLVIEKPKIVTGAGTDGAGQPPL
jgi:hypothetical protein